MERTPFNFLHYGFKGGCFSDFFVVTNDEVRKFVGNHDHLHLFGNNSPKVSDIQWKEERQMDWPMRKPMT